MLLSKAVRGTSGAALRQAIEAKRIIVRTPRGLVSVLARCNAIARLTNYLVTVPDAVSCASERVTTYMPLCGVSVLTEAPNKRRSKTHVIGCHYL